MLLYTLFMESVLFALQALLVNKLRTFLSLLGITIGIFAIISVFTVVDSLENNLRKSVSTLGDNVIFVEKWPWTFGPDYPWWKYLNRPLPRVHELEFLQKRLRYAEAATLIVSGHRTVRYQSSSVLNAEIVAVSSDYDKVKFVDLDQGRYFTENESSAGKNIAVIGYSIANGLFPGGNALGKEIKIDGRNVLVIGVLKKQGDGLNIFGSADTQLILPINFVRNIIDINSDNINPTIMVKAKAGVSNEQLIDELRGVMRAVRKLKPTSEDDFALNQSSLISNVFDNLFSKIGLVGWIIGSFSILIGGFGIANIMFVSVKERTPVIGIQKALGAKRSFIMIQFLTEAVFLSVLGGSLGLLLVLLGTFLAAGSFGMELSLSAGNCLMGLIISAIIGVVSGLIPSYAASRLDPVEAIRSS